MSKYSHSDKMGVSNQFYSMIRDTQYPCLGAKSALSKSSVVIDVFANPDEETAIKIVVEIDKFESKRGTEHSEVYSSYVAIFDSWEVYTEHQYETELWGFLQLLHNVDVANGNKWDAKASFDTKDPYFGFSINSNAYFLVGMHPKSSRLSRRFHLPAIVFNSHRQFSVLREQGLFEQLKKKIRMRDKKLQGTYNPEMVGTKEISEARQYSGRKCELNWTCPLKVENNNR